MKLWKFKCVVDFFFFFNTLKVKVELRSLQLMQIFIDVLNHLDVGHNWTPVPQIIDRSGASASAHYCQDTRAAPRLQHSLHCQDLDLFCQNVFLFIL